MAVSVLIPTPLHGLTGGVDTVELEAETVDNLLQGLDDRYPGLRSRMRMPNGSWNRFVNIYVNGEDIRFLQSGETPLTGGEEVSIVMASAGG